MIALGWLRRNWLLVALALGTIAATGAAVWWVRHTASVERENALMEREAAELRRQLEQAATDARARERASIERQADTARIEASKDEVIDAIRKAPDAAPAGARVALNCSRLRRAGVAADRLPAACR